MRLKVCGMKVPENMEQVASLEPAHLGFIFYPASPRFFEGSIPALEDGIRKTGVFVNATLEEVLDTAEKHGLQSIQLHGEESPELCSAIKAASLEVIKVFSVKDRFDFQRLKAYEGAVDLFLFDTKGPAKGGNGTTFNWEVLKNYDSPTPFMLSGGIGMEEIRAIGELHRYFRKQQKEHLFKGVDVNSRFETEPGLKDVQKLREFQDKLRQELRHKAGISTEEKPDREKNQKKNNTNDISSKR